MNRKLVLAKSTLQANNPKNPRHPKPFRVSYYLRKEVEKDGYAPLHIVEVMARTAWEAEKKVLNPNRVHVCSYKAVGMPSLDDKRRRCSIYTLSPNFVVPPDIVGRGVYVRKYPICKLPGCGQPNPPYKSYHSRACYRALRNKRQLLTKRQRLARSKKIGVLLCHHCAARPIGTLSPTRCNKCFLDTRKITLPIRIATKQVLRLQQQIPVITEILLNSSRHKCFKHAKFYQGSRIPRCGCRFHAYQWLVLNMERYIILRRPLMSYVAKQEPLPPWFQKTRPRRVFMPGEFQPMAGDFYPANQAVSAVAI
jgi:hypothetical protein